MQWGCFKLQVLKRKTTQKATKSRKMQQKANRKTENKIHKISQGAAYRLFRDIIIF